jgi:hypothetical protein
VHAERGAARGVDALYELVPWEAVEFAYDYAVRAPVQTIPTAWDEAVVAALEKRRSQSIGTAPPAPAPTAASGPAKPARRSLFGIRRV